MRHGDLDPTSRRRFLQAAAGASLAAGALHYTPARAATPSPSPLPPASPDPEFSWDQVPGAALLEKVTGDFTTLETAFIGKHFFFVALLPTGMPDNPPGENFVETGDARNARLLKAANPQLKVLIAWNWQGDVANYQAYTHPGYDPAWRLAQHRRHIHDITLEAFRAWWAGAAATMIDRPEFDGIYVDGIDDDVPNKNVIDLLARLRHAVDALPSRKIVLLRGSGRGPLPGNPQSPYAYADGEAVVHFGNFGNGTPDAMRGCMNQMAALALSGKIVLFKAWPPFVAGDPNATEMSYRDRVAFARRSIGFPLACFLAAAQPRCYFQYGWGFDNDQGTYVLQNDRAKANRQIVDGAFYSELLQSLGPPLANPSIRGYEYARRFERAALRVNVQTRQVAINWT